jgi:TRAP-type C4-dicarboxylate transport system permease small subunit
MRALLRAYDGLIGLAAGIASLGIAFIALGVTADVLLRYFFCVSIKWMLETSEYILFGITFLGAPWALREGAHTAVDIVVQALPPLGKRVCGVAANAVGLATSLGLLWYGGLAAWRSFANGTMIFKTVVFPEWCILAFIPFCGALLSVEFVRLLIRIARGDTSVLARRQATA